MTAQTATLTREQRWTRAANEAMDSARPVGLAMMELANEEQAELRRKVEAWIRHGEAVPADVTTYDRAIVHDELRALFDL